MRLFILIALIALFSVALANPVEGPGSRNPEKRDPVPGLPPDDPKPPKTKPPPSKSKKGKKKKKQQKKWPKGACTKEIGCTFICAAGSSYINCSASKVSSSSLGVKSKPLVHP
jgi:hypothetical protein